MLTSTKTVAQTASCRFVQCSVAVVVPRAAIAQQRFQYTHPLVRHMWCWRLLQTAVGHSPAVHLLAATSLSLPPSASLNKVSKIVVGFTNTLNMRKGDTVQLALPGFGGAGLPSFSVGQLTSVTQSHLSPEQVAAPMSVLERHNSIDIASSSWNLGTTTLKLAMNSAVVAKSPFVVTVAQAAGIKLPTSSLSRNLQALTIEFIDVAGGNATNIGPVSDQ